MQLALLDQAPSPIFDPELSGSVRRDLGEGAWVEHVPGWVRGHLRLFDQLRGELGWRRTTQILFDAEVENPRRLAVFPDDGPAPRFVLELASALSARYGVRFDRLSAALYRDGRDSVAWHRDREHRERARAIVAIVSLGAPRRFLLRPYRDGSRGSSHGPTRSDRRATATPPRRSVVYNPGWGDLLVMGGTAQRTWEHAVPKTRHADPRIALMFRHHPDALGPSGGQGSGIRS